MILSLVKFKIYRLHFLFLVIQCVPKKLLIIFRKDWKIFSKTVFELEISFISTSFNKNSILSHITK